MNSEDTTESDASAPTELKAAQRLFEFWASYQYWQLLTKKPRSKKC